VRTLADHFSTFDALHALATEYPLLPAADIHTVSGAPGELMVACFGPLTDFEQWREALHIDADGVEYEVTAADQIHLLGEAKFAGATVVLHGYSPRVRQSKAEAA
jgi:hypothetical protein